MGSGILENTNFTLCKVVTNFKSEFDAFLFLCYCKLQVLAACQAGTMFSIIDRDMGSYNTECVKKFMQLALKCCEDEMKARPTMLEVVRELENLCSMPLQSDVNQSDQSNASSSGSSGLTPASLYYERNTSTDYYLGSDLDSGVFPHIKPR